MYNRTGQNMFGIPSITCDWIHSSRIPRGHILTPTEQMERRPMELLPVEMIPLLQQTYFHPNQKIELSWIRNSKICCLRSDFFSYLNQQDSYSHHYWEDPFGPNFFQWCQISFSFSFLVEYVMVRAVPYLSTGHGHNHAGQREASARIGTRIAIDCS